MAATRHTTRWKKSDLGWLALALMVHGAVLFTPLRHWHHQAESKAVISVQLVPHLRSREPPAAPEVPPLPAPQTTLPAPLKPASELSAAPPTPETGPADPSLPDETTGDMNRLSTARLVDQVSRMRFTDKPTASPRQLGSSEYSRRAPPWRTGANSAVLLPQSNTFDGMVAPAKTEVVDQWQAADGSLNVVINTPGGETLCGRAQAWDPMHPLVEYVMLFRGCGGGGKRTFTMEKRELP